MFLRWVSYSIARDFAKLDIVFCLCSRIETRSSTLRYSDLQNATNNTEAKKELDYEYLSSKAACRYRTAGAHTLIEELHVECLLRRIENATGLCAIVLDALNSPFNTASRALTSKLSS